MKQQWTQRTQQKKGKRKTQRGRGSRGRRMSRTDGRGRRRSTGGMSMGKRYSEMSDNEAFGFFLSHCRSIDLLSTGSSGIVFLATLSSEVESPYMHMELTNYGTPITQVLIKVGCVHGKKNEYKLPYIIEEKKKKMYSVSKNDFMREVNIQAHLVRQTMHYLDPICPSIVYATCLQREHYLVDLLLRNRADTLLDSINDCPEIKIGMIIMEYIEHSALLSMTLKNPPPLGEAASATATHTVAANGEAEANGEVEAESLAMASADSEPSSSSTTHLPSPPPFSKDTQTDYYIAAAAYVVLQMANLTGYTHGDFHAYNLLIQPSNANYFMSLPFRVTLIDFGLVNRIPDTKLLTLQEYIASHKYTDALKLLCKVRRLDGESLLSYPAHYGYLCGTYNAVNKTNVTDFPPTMNSIIKKLFDTRNGMITHNVMTYNMSTIRRRDDMPESLPASKEWIDKHCFSEIEQPIMDAIPYSTYEPRLVVAVPLTDNVKIMFFTNYARTLSNNEIYNIYTQTASTLEYNMRKTFIYLLFLFYITACGHFVYILNKLPMVADETNTPIFGYFSTYFARRLFRNISHLIPITIEKHHSKLFYELMDRVTELFTNTKVEIVEEYNHLIDKNDKFLTDLGKCMSTNEDTKLLTYVFDKYCKPNSN